MIIKKSIIVYRYYKVLSQFWLQKCEKMNWPNVADYKLLTFGLKV